MSSATKYAHDNATAFRQQLRDWLRIPSISTLPENVGAVQEAAEWLADNMHRSGLENVQIMPTDGHPVVYADWLHAGSDKPTVIVYGHYDVQPALKEDGWYNEPFAPEEREGKLYARGASDDKGQIFIHVKAVESLLESQGHLPVNIKFFVEGEEEIGSPNLPTFVHEQRDLLAADVCVISDTAIVSVDQPSVIYSLRGLVGLEIEVQGPAQDLHSGVFGGSVHNPIQALTEILAALHDDNGMITVPGFYDSVIPLTSQERTELKKTTWEQAEWKEMTGAPQPWGEAEFTLSERVSARPTLEINGIIGGFTGTGLKTVLPARATAKISCRLVADQDPLQIFQLVRDHIIELAKPTVNVSVRRVSGIAFPALIDITEPAMQAAVTAYEKVWGKTPVYLREGGSLPIVADVQRELNAPVILMGFGLHTDNAHGPNEHFLLDLFQKGIDTTIHYYNEIAQQHTVSA
jgi:acetylornithine deacetylase/succinyl-diaminopimelate desuccinylase-like protein